MVPSQQFLVSLDMALGFVESFPANLLKEIWALYKEVAPYYEAGLEPPDDVTLLFTDDNFGNMNRLPIRNESRRAGGCGVRPLGVLNKMVTTKLWQIYYHFEYVGLPRSYKWANTNNLVWASLALYRSFLKVARPRLNFELTYK